MTPGTLTQFEKGKSYKSFVLYVSPKAPRYVNVQMKDGACYKVEVSGTPSVDLFSLKDTFVELVCTEVTDKGPEFALTPRYYAQPAPAVPTASASAPGPAAPARPRPVRGGQTGLVEGPTLELKRSLVFSPTTHQPDSDQPFEIAKEIAAFMNAAGGDLYLGVDDRGFVTGIESDLPHLGEAPIMMDKVLDDKYDYHPDFDHFTIKLTTAVRCYLGTAAAALVGPVDLLDDASCSGLHYVRVHVKPSPEVVYLGREESVVYRAQTSVLYLRGRQRDLYVRERFHGKAASGPDSSQIDALLEKIAEQGKTIASMQEEIRKALQSASPAPAGVAKKKPATIHGLPIVAASNTTVPFERHHVDALARFEGLTFDGRLVGGATTWSDLFVEFLKQLAFVDPAKFETLPDDPSFRGRGNRAIFVRRGSRTRLRDASGYLGPKNDIRADRRDGYKENFLKDDGLFVRLVRHFGLKPEQFRIWTGKQA